MIQNNFIEHSSRWFTSLVLVHFSQAKLFKGQRVSNRLAENIFWKFIGQTNCILIQARIAQLVAYRLGTGEVPGSNPGKGENFSVKISNWIVQI